jgi:hypothetical protein
MAEAMAWPRAMPSTTMALRMILLISSFSSGMGGALMVTRSWYTGQIKSF